MRKSTKLAVVFAAAMLLVVGFAMTAIAGTAHWDSSTGQWQYFNADGDLVTNDKVKWQGKYYFVDEDGNLVTNKLWEFDGARYYTDANGNLVTGWAKVPADETDEELGVTYRWYYFQSSGKAFTSDNYAAGVTYKTIDGKRYKFDTDGKMLFGFILGNDMITDGNKADQADVYYGTNETGAAVTDWVQYTDEESDKAYWYYFNKGVKKFNEAALKINGKYYAFDATGRMQSGWQPDVATANTYFNDNGDQVKKAWVYAVPKANENDDDPSKKWFYFGADGKTYASQVAKINGKFYAFDDDAKMLAKLVWVDDNAIVGQAAAGSVQQAVTSSIANFVADAATNYPTMSLYYFSGDYANDGARKVSTTVEYTFSDDAKATFVFDKAGKALHGLNNKKIYNYGMLQKAGDAKYKVVTNPTAAATEQQDYLVNAYGAVVNAKSTGKADDDTVYAVRAFVAGDPVIGQFRDFEGVNTVAGAWARQADFTLSGTKYSFNPTSALYAATTAHFETTAYMINMW